LQSGIAGSSLATMADVDDRRASMKEDLETRIPRRDLLRLTLAGAGAASVGALLPAPVAAKPVDMKDKRRARYQPDSAEVRNFYRVNSYPGAR
jgi:hypothetical protein